MNKVRASITLLMLLGAASAHFGGCTADDPPPNNATGGSGGGSSSGVAANCGDGKLDNNEACDDGNNAPNDGCTGCAMDECYTCTAEPGNASICTFAMAATACQSTKVCDGNGTCVECLDDAQCTGGFCYQKACHKCDDGTKNGDESDVDCGGAKCGKCASGKTCGIGDDCTSTFCVDGVCCAEACDGVCLACNISGSEGTCDFIPKYAEDPVYGMGMSCKEADGKVCNGGGSCGAALGQPCQGPTGCASMRCGDPDGDGTKTCVKNTGEDCTMNTECFNNMCDPGTMKCL